MTKLKVEVDAIPVMVEINALPGDLLLFINGVCIGVQQAAERKAERFNASPLSRQPRGGLGGDPNSDAALLEALRQHGPLTTARLLDVLGLHGKDPKRKLTRQRLHRLIARKLVRPVRGEKGKRRPEWEVA